MAVHGPLVDSYRTRPRLAAQKAAWHHRAATAARDDGRYDDAVDHHDQADAYTTVLDQLGRCRRCGRTLRTPESLARRIGPECIRKAGERT